jgi:two-component system sensor histidine kinase QseC
VQYCTHGGSIRLRVERGQLSISNTTDDLNPDDLPHLFERFWRKDPARSSSVHSGLGLALAKAYAAALGLELRAELSDTKQITFVLSGGQTASAVLGSLQNAASHSVR